ncbi:MarR family transcriptional regulator [Tessaracoccus sp. MC1756]|uniref:MarR family winged helix-turn-helix transcriptional regulator n=1 Tax=Tessaracoccus sp. MC1756 TaxID=2760311 RepID=UPI001600E7CC|nr:MarR family transcriptional regulator [Tessaracoccus sp. MC1756]
MSDEVDGVVAAWQRVRPDLQLAPLQVWSRIDRLAGTLAVQRKAAFARHEIEGWEFDVLAALRRAGNPYQMTPGQLLKETHVTSGTMTNRVDRLVSRGAVTREPDPHDGRGVLVSLTEYGLTLVDAAMATLIELEADLLEQWNQADQDRLANYLRRLLLGSS